MDKKRRIRLVFAGSALILFTLLLGTQDMIDEYFGLIVFGVFLALVRFAGVFWIIKITTIQRRRGLWYLVLGLFSPGVTFVILGLIGERKRK